MGGWLVAGEIPLFRALANNMAPHMTKHWRMLTNHWTNHLTHFCLNISLFIDLMHKSWSGPCILRIYALLLVTPREEWPITTRKFRISRIHGPDGPDHDLCIRSIVSTLCSYVAYAAVCLKLPNNNGEQNLGNYFIPRAEVDPRTEMGPCTVNIRQACPLWE